MQFLMNSAHVKQPGLGRNPPGPKQPIPGNECKKAKKSKSGAEKKPENPIPILYEA